MVAMDHLSGPFWGNVVVIVLAASITIACFVAMFRMLIDPGERDPRHPKYSILDETRRGGG
jgi:hypothetical protein